MEILPLFLVSLILWLGAVLLGTGLFTTYFGAGKSRIIGLVIFILGAGIVAFIVLTQVPSDGPILAIDYFSEVDILPHLVGIAGAILGAVIGLLLFLFSLMKA